MLLEILIRNFFFKVIFFLKIQLLKKKFLIYNMSSSIFCNPSPMTNYSDLIYFSKWTYYWSLAPVAAPWVPLPTSLLRRSFFLRNVDLSCLGSHRSGSGSQLGSKFLGSFLECFFFFFFFWINSLPPGVLWKQSRSKL